MEHTPILHRYLKGREQVALCKLCHDHAIDNPKALDRQLHQLRRSEKQDKLITLPLRSRNKFGSYHLKKVEMTPAYKKWPNHATSGLLGNIGRVAGLMTNCDSCIENSK